MKAREEIAWRKILTKSPLHYSRHVTYVMLPENKHSTGVCYEFYSRSISKNLIIVTDRHTV